MSPTAEEWLAVAAEAREAELEFIAAGLAYYALMAVTPALVFGFLVMLAVGGETLAAGIVAGTANVLSPAGQRFIQGSVREVSARNGVGVVALLLAVWGAFRLYRGLEHGVERIYGVERAGVDSPREVVRILVFGGLGTFGVFGVAAASSLHAAGGVARLVAIPLTFLVAVVVSYPILNGMAPDLDRAQSVPGSLFTAVTWTLGAAAVGVVAGGQSRALYGVLGGLLLLLTWFFLASYLLLLGFTVDAVCSRRAVFERARE